MKFNHLILLCIIASSHSVACGVHQNTGFSFITEPGSLDVFQNVIENRRLNSFSQMQNSQRAQKNAFIGALEHTDKKKMNFIIFEAIKGHYSQVTLNNTVTITAYNIEGNQPAIDENSLLVISDFDVLDALGAHQLSWQQAQNLGLVKINGQQADVDSLNAWFMAIFPAV